MPGSSGEEGRHGGRFAGATCRREGGIGALLLAACGRGITVFLQFTQYAHRRAVPVARNAEAREAREGKRARGNPVELGQVQTLLMVKRDDRSHTGTGVSLRSICRRMLTARRTAAIPSACPTHAWCFLIGACLQSIQPVFQRLLLLPGGRRCYGRCLAAACHGCRRSCCLGSAQAQKHVQLIIVLILCRGPGCGGCTRRLPYRLR